MTSVITTHPNVLGGTPVFAGTRVPVEALFDYLQRGRPLAEFFEDFPAVRPEQVDRVLDDARAHAVGRRIAS